MKLLTPQEVKNKKQQEQDREVLRITSIRETLKEETNRLNELEATFDKRLNEQRQQWLKEEEKTLGKLSSLEKTLEEYKEKERSYFFPIQAIERKAYDNYERSKAALAEAEQKQKDCDALEEKLHDKLDSLEEKQNELDDREQKIALKEDGIVAQQLQIKHLTDDLNNKWQEFNARSLAHDAKFHKDKRVLELAKNNLEEREDALLLQKEELNVQMQRLQSQRSALAVAFRELENKKHEKNNIISS